jgi:two-component system sensor histidine kinase DctS
MNLMDLLSPKSPERTAIEAAELFRRALERAPAPEGVETRLEAADAAPLWVDVDQALHALTNVLAYQYGTLGGSGVVRLRAHGNGPVSLDLIDSGPGLTPEEKATLLDWQTVDGLAVLRMGLAAAERLARANGGRLQWESRPRVGTRFSLLLPARPAFGE